MDIIELKEQILNNSLGNTLMVWVYEDNKFIVNEYIDAICKNNNFKRHDVFDLEEFNDIYEDSFGFYEDCLHIYEVDTLKESFNTKITNAIVICKKIDTNREKELEKFVIKFPKLENWQIESYVKESLKGLNDKEISFLCDITNHDIYRLDNEITKLNVFPKDIQLKIFKDLVIEGGYSDLTNLDIFSLTNGIVKRDLNVVDKVLKDIKLIDVEPVGLVTILLKQFKNIIDIQTNKSATYESTGMSQKQFNAVKYNCGKYTTSELIKIYNLLLSIDERLKNGELDSSLIIDYVICNIMK